MSGTSVKIALGGREWEITRARLGGFIRLQREREGFYKAKDTGDNRAITGALHAFLSVALSDLTLEEFYNAPWWEIFIAYIKIEKLNILPYRDDFAILQFSMVGGRPVPWDNPLRSDILWVHLIASRYNWSKEEIEHLWPEDAIAFVQEILSDQQQENEFIHQLSEVAYEYNKSTKKSHYKPLQRPMWMTARRKKDIITKIRRDMLPVGNVVFPEGVDEELIH